MDIAYIIPTNILRIILSFQKSMCSMFLLPFLSFSAIFAISDSWQLEKGVQVFINKKNIQNYSVFHYKNETDYTFVEYKLYLENAFPRSMERHENTLQKNHNTLNVIIFENGDWNFDCLYNSEKNDYEGYSMDILNVVEEMTNTTFLKQRYVLFMFSRLCTILHRVGTCR